MQRRLFFVRLALQNTFKKRLRAMLAIGGIALTSAVMIALFGIEKGLQQLIQQEISSADARDVVTVSQRNVQRIRLDDAKTSDIQSISGVSQVGQSVGLPGNAMYHGINLDLPVYGVSNEYFSMGPTTTVRGSVENQPTESNVVVSSKVLEVFGIGLADAIGKQLSVSAIVSQDYASTLKEEEKKTPPITYTIIGVVSRGQLPVIFMPIEQLRQQGVDSVSQLKVRVGSAEKVPAVRETIEQTGLQTTSILDTIERINQLFDVIQNILLIFGVVVFVITVSGTFTIITLTLMEETKQIGFLRIMGLRHSDVKTLFIVQSILLTSLGSLGGVVLGTVAGWVINGFARSAASAESFSGNISLFLIPVEQIIIILMLSILIGWAVGIIPTKRATLINPLKELEM